MKKLIITFIGSFIALFIISSICCAQPRHGLMYIGKDIDTTSFLDTSDFMKEDSIYTFTIVTHNNRNNAICISRVRADTDIRHYSVIYVCIIQNGQRVEGTPASNSYTYKENSTVYIAIGLIDKMLGGTQT